MMDSMVQYTSATLLAVADFLAAEPIIYLFAIACMACIIKAFRALLP